MPFLHGGIGDMGISVSHLLIVMVIVLIVFGAGKLPKVMNDLAKGIKAFKDGLKDDKNNGDS
ncbi:MAG: Sec-independent protein translocase subunit TatA [Holosporales bacterium]|nr:Sec-independent protein translocase subunit TatA [Holosporales bacterium]